MEPVFIGIDGGGTRTRAVAARSDLVPLGRGTSGPANAATSPLPRVVESVHEAVSDACLAANLQEPPDGVAVGLAGIDSITDRRPLVRALEMALGTSRILLTSDARIALAGVSPDRLDAPAVVIIAGTGVIAFGQDAAGAVARAGGYGPLLSDEGGGFAIARQGLVAVVREIDGRGPPTAIRELLFSAGGVSSLAQLLEGVYRRSDGGFADVAAYFPIVVAAARANDLEARRIFERAGRDLALAVVTVVRKLGLENAAFPVATIGGVFTAGDLLLGPLRAELLRVAPHARIGPPAYPPEIGAIRLALRARDGAP